MKTLALDFLHTFKFFPGIAMLLEMESIKVLKVRKGHQQRVMSMEQRLANQCLGAQISAQQNKVDRGYNESTVGKGRTYTDWASIRQAAGTFLSLCLSSLLSDRPCVILIIDHVLKKKKEENKQYGAKRVSGSFIDYVSLIHHTNWASFNKFS